MKNELKKRILSSVVLLPLVIIAIIKGSYSFYFLCIITLFISAFEWITMTKNKPYNLIGLIFLLISFYSFYSLRIIPDNNYSIILIIITICILTDIGGFIFGKILKGPKLSKFSPNKTYSGAICGLLLSLCSIPFFLTYNFINNNEINLIILFFVLVSAISQAGDIIISYFKRLLNIKDTGKIIPGHGGILDRIDGMIFAFPLSYIFLKLGLFKNIFI